MADTNQTELKRDAKGRIIGGKPPAGFDTHPENRNPGGWDKTQSISYQYNRIGRMSDDEIENFVPENQFQKIALARVKAARDEKFGLPDAKEISDRTEGKAPQYIGMGNPEDAKKALVEFIYGTADSNDSDTDRV